MSPCSYVVRVVPTLPRPPQEVNGAAAGGDGPDGKQQPQPWYFHVVASLILVVHGFTFLVPSDPESEDTDMVRTVAKWFGYECDWVKVFTPYAQVSYNAQIRLEGKVA